MQVTITEQKLEVLVEQAQYSAATLHKCFYWYTRDYQVTIDSISPTHVSVRLCPKDGGAFTVSPAALVDQVHNDLVDFKLRELIGEETRSIRELLVAKAFAHFDTEQPLLADISDPVGFHLVQPEGKEA